LALKLLIFEPTGAILAAPTCSLPEYVGGTRNWDYRFMWIRDSSFTLYALLKLGFTEEARAFMDFIIDRCNELEGDFGKLQIMYSIHGHANLDEIVLDHWEGYKGSSPVRIGNGAFHQLQLDIYGELMDTIYLADKYSRPVSYEIWIMLRKLVDWVCDNWNQKDEGIWEVRGGRQHFTYSKVLLWVAIDRGIRLAEKRSLPADIHRWRTIRDEICEFIHSRCWNSKRNCFMQVMRNAEDDHNPSTLDASVLIMPLMLFSSPVDPKILSTIEQICKPVREGGLMSNSLVYRYDVNQTDDGVSGEEGTFSICTFWLAEAMARAGSFEHKYLEQARWTFEQMIGYANHVGLFSEEIGLTGEALGNFPQAFSHLSLISAAIAINRGYDRRNHHD
jgi:GH15 family glucan-1,4-alpha-glucosidase